MSRTRSVALVYNEDKPAAVRAVALLERWLRRRGISVTRQDVERSHGLVVALGGNGTMLRAARLAAVARVPVLGVNLGRLGFLAGTGAGRALSTLSGVIRGRGKVEARMLLRAEVVSRGKVCSSHLALNDVVIRCGSLARVITCRMGINGRFVTEYVGDGLIISTPTGSTAYALAANGPIVFPELSLIQITPICPHMLGQRPLITRGEDELEIRVTAPGDAPATLAMDGQENLTLQGGEVIRIRRAAERLRLVVLSEYDYYQTLRTKLGWGRRQG